MTHEQVEKPRRQVDRPFPWCCPNCLKEEVYPETTPYSADVPHDGRRYHVEIPQLKIPKCRACGTLLFSNRVDDEIVRAMRVQARLLMPEQIKSGRETLGLKSNEFAERLGVAPETISRWEKGGMIQSRAMDNLLRLYFSVPEVRAVLRGTEQDPNLGVIHSLRADSPKSPTDRKEPRHRHQDIYPPASPPKGRYLIDGYSLLHAMGVLIGHVLPQDLEKARTTLLDRLFVLHGEDADRVTVVFDAVNAPASTDVQQAYKGVTVRFSVRGGADDLIETMIQCEAAPRLLTIVSDDRRLQEACRRRQCPTLGCLDYLEQVQRQPTPAASSDAPVKPQVVSPSS